MDDQASSITNLRDQIARDKQKIRDYDNFEKEDKKRKRDEAAAAAAGGAATAGVSSAHSISIALIPSLQL